MTDQRLHVAPAIVPCGSSLTAPGSSGPGGSFSDELARLQHDYRVARGGDRGAAYRRLRDRIHRELAEELS